MTVSVAEPLRFVIGQRTASPAVPSKRHWAHRITSGLLDCLALLALVWSIPVAILLVGTPIVLGITLILWLARVAQNLF